MDNILNCKSKSGKDIRLTKVMWDKITEGHPEFGEEHLEEIRESVESPDYVVEGWNRELLALRWCIKAPKEPKYLCVVYRELNGEGFIITAFFISRYGKLLRRNVIWQK